MKIPRIYLETTIFNFPFVDDAPDLRAGTIRLFRDIGLSPSQANTQRRNWKKPTMLKSFQK